MGARRLGHTSRPRAARGFEERHVLLPGPPGLRPGPADLGGNWGGRARGLRGCGATSGSIRGAAGCGWPAGQGGGGRSGEAKVPPAAATC